MSKSIDSGGLSLAEIMRQIIRGYRVLIAFGLAGGMLAAIHLALSPAKYQAEARLLVDPRPLMLPGQTGWSQPIRESRTALALLESEVRVATSPAVLLAAIDQLGLDADREFTAPDPTLSERLWNPIRVIGDLVPQGGTGAAAPECPEASDDPGRCQNGARLAALSNLRKAITIRRVNKTFVIQVRARSEEAAKSMRIVDAIVAAYLAERRRSDAGRLEEAHRNVSSGQLALQGNLRAGEGRIDEATRRLRAIVGSQGDVDEQQLKETMRALMEARALTQTLRIQVERLSKLSAAGTDLDGEDLSELPALESLRLKAASLAREEGAAAASFGPRHPGTKALAQQRSRIASLLRQEIARSAEAIRNEFAQARKAEEMLSARADALERKTLTAAQARVELRQLERVAEADGAVYESSLRRATELEAGSAVAAADLRVLDHAGVPRGPATPRMSFVLFAVMAGLTTGAAFLSIRSRPPSAGPDSAFEPSRALIA